MIQGVRDRLFDAIRCRLRADVPIGVFLSGGIDSSALAGMVTHLMKTEGAQMGTAPPSERINCFSVKFIGEEHDEERKSSSLLLSLSTLTQENSNCAKNSGVAGREDAPHRDDRGNFL